jgi:hypothetical protein
MCVVSMIGDHYSQKWTSTGPGIQIQAPGYSFPPLLVTKAEFDELKREVLEMKALLIKAADYDKKNNEPNCEQEDKVKLLKQIAQMVGISLEEVFK